MKEARDSWSQAAKIINDANRWFDDRCPYCRRLWDGNIEKMPDAEKNRREELLKTIEHIHIGPAATKIEGWSHCKKCGKSIERFHFSSKEEFEKEMKLRSICPWCDGKAEVWHERNDLSIKIMPNSLHEVDIDNYDDWQKALRESHK